jgi:hypothetical protein
MKTQEPVAVINGLTAMIEAAIAVAVGFGLNWTSEQVGLVMAVVVAGGNVLNTLWARAKVTPTVSRRVSRRDADNRSLVPAQARAVTALFANKKRVLGVL